MLAKYGIDPSRNLKWAEQFGTLTLETIQKVHARFAAEPDISPEFDFMLNVAQMDDSDLDFSRLMTVRDATSAIVRAAGSTCPLPRMAIFAPKDLQFGLGNIFVTLLGQQGAIEANIFRTEPEAWAWLGQDIRSLDDIRHTQRGVVAPG